MVCRWGKSNACPCAQRVCESLRRGLLFCPHQRFAVQGRKCHVQNNETRELHAAIAIPRGCEFWTAVKVKYGVDRASLSGW